MLSRSKIGSSTPDHRLRQEEKSGRDRGQRFEGQRYVEGSGRRDSGGRREAEVQRRVHYLGDEEDPWDHAEAALEELLAEVDEEEDEQHEVNVMSSDRKERGVVKFPKKVERIDQVCRRYLFDGKCDLDNCRFVHQWKRMHDERMKYARLWGAEKGNSVKKEGESRMRQGFRPPGEMKIKDVRVADVFGEGSEVSGGDESEDCNRYWRLDVVHKCGERLIGSQVSESMSLISSLMERDSGSM
jgi:hypothetical protein